MAFLELKR